jgi:large subunit ribosomal protein L24
MAKCKIKRDDDVVVIAGNHKGTPENPTVGRVLQVLPEQSKVLVEKVNMVRRNVKPAGDRPGGVMEKEAAIHISNVALWDAEAKQRIKVAWKVSDDGSKIRVNRQTGTTLGAK